MQARARNSRIRASIAHHRRDLARQIYFASIFKCNHTNTQTFKLHILTEQLFARARHANADPIQVLDVEECQQSDRISLPVYAHSLVRE